MWGGKKEISLGQKSFGKTGGDGLDNVDTVSSNGSAFHELNTQSQTKYAAPEEVPGRASRATLHLRTGTARGTEMPEPLVLSAYAPEASFSPCSALWRRPSSFLPSIGIGSRNLLSSVSTLLNYPQISSPPVLPRPGPPSFPGAKTIQPFLCHPVQTSQPREISRRISIISVIRELSEASGVPWAGLSQTRLTLSARSTSGPS